MMDSAKIGLLVGLLEDQQRKNQAAEAAAKKQQAQQAQQAQQGGQGGQGGGEGGGCGAKQPASPQAQQGARECQSACGAQRQQAVGENGCQGAGSIQAQAPRPSRGIGEGTPDRNPPPEAQDPVRNPPNPPRNPPPDAQDPVRNPPRNPPPDNQGETPRNPSPDAAATRRVNAVANANAARVANAATAEQLRAGREEGERSAMATTGDARGAEVAQARQVRPANAATPEQLQAGREEGERSAAATTGDARGAEIAQARTAQQTPNARVAEGHAAFNRPANAATPEQLQRGREEGERSAAATTGDARAAEIAQQRPATPPATTPPKNEKLEKVLKENPNIKTSQDLINHLYKKGGGDWAGAVAQAKEAGVKMTELLADRRGDISKRVGGEPAAPPPPPAPPARQDPPAREPQRTMIA
jgi:hypothetical protein